MDCGTRFDQSTNEAKSKKGVCMMDSFWISVKERLPERECTPYPTRVEGLLHWQMQTYRKMGDSFVRDTTHWLDVWENIPPPPAPEDSPLVKELKALKPPINTVHAEILCQEIDRCIQVVNRHESEAR